jgi:glycosyltransferase involved in cell wall biosynthesis
VEKKLRILFLSQVTIFSLDDKNIYVDLIQEFLDHGHHITLISALERRNLQNVPKQQFFHKNFELIRVSTPNLQKTTVIEKSIGHMMFDFQILYAIKKHLKKEEFDICLYFSPPITIIRTLSYVKRRYKTFNYLWLKDIFPQNAVDMGIIKQNSLAHKYFKKIELKYYELSDAIGVMSPANRNYLLNHTSGQILESKVEVCPNCVRLSIDSETNKPIGAEVDILKFVYGGNLGLPQAISFLIEILEYYINHPKIKFEIIGSGTEYHKLEKWINIHSPQNVVLIPHLHKNQFIQIVLNSDIGLILLSHKFTIPNFPSRLLTYLECKKPILCFTDEITDIGMIAKQNNFGDWTTSNEISAAVKLINQYLLMPKSDLVEMGEEGHKYLLSNYTAFIAYEKILDSFVKFLKKTERNS